MKRRTEIQGRPLSPIVEELISHFESRCGSSVHDEDAETTEVTEEKGQRDDNTARSLEQCAERNAGPPEQRVEHDAGAQLSVDNVTTVAAAVQEIASAVVEAFTDRPSELSLASVKTSPSSGTASSDGLAQLNYDSSPLTKVEQWLERFVDNQEFDDPELASPFASRFERTRAHSLIPPADLPRFEFYGQRSPTSSEHFSDFSYRPVPKSPSDITSSSPSSLKESDLALVRKPSRVISPTPKLRRKKREVHIHLSLTDSQLETMASLLASSANRIENEQCSPTPPEKSQGSRKKTLHHKEGSSSLGSHTHRRMPCEDHDYNKYDLDRQYGPSMGVKSTESKEKERERPTTVETDWSAIIRTVSRSPTQDKLSPTKASSSRTKIPAPVQKDKKRPVPLNLADARKYGEIVSSRKNIEVVHNPVPTTPALEGNNSTIVNNNNYNDASSSVYTSDPPTTSTPVISPLHITKRTANIGRKLNVLRAYNDYKESVTPNPESALLKTPFRSKSATVSDMKQKEPEVTDTSTMPTTMNSSPRHSYSQQGNMRPGIPKSATTNDLKRDAGQSEPFTPLTPWLLAGSVHIKKNLFGEHGWLKDTSAAEAKPEPQRKSGIFDGIKKVARDLAEKADFKNNGSRPRSKNFASTATSPRRQSVSKRLTISLDPREQSLLYCELEFTLSNALDIYIKTQLNGGRLDPAKLKKVSDSWATKGRPRVVGFRYDLETQIELVRLHLYQFRFYHSHYSNHHHHRDTLSGGAEDSTTAVDAVLYAVKCNARVMRVRTLCQPDSVIAKHVLDAQALLGLLGAAEGMHRALAEVSQFFKVVVERERAVRRTREASIRALPHEVAAAMGNDSSMMSVTQAGDVSFQQQQNENYNEENSQVPEQYRQQMNPPTAIQRPSEQVQQKVSFAAVPQSPSAAAGAGVADTSMAEQSEADQSVLHYAPPPPPKLGDQDQQQGDDSLLTLPSKTYRAPSGERCFL
ncbi:hypothetical protein PG996_003378 [Apiospora saccharicola]|uniref:Uncharacterized protein n=1 Tax=Apiospora saccharicola TaxID=335842 RepID=A0ABR1W4Y8_9PEZI